MKQNQANQLAKMTGTEKQATGLLAGLFSLRMLGLFMLLPVLALYANDFSGADQRRIGLALGIYGLTQAIFQIPLGMLSDRIGRKPVILAGLLLLAIGSLVAARASSIEGLILGRALQGAGAIGATLLAFAADATRQEVRSRAMAVIGITIGLSFGVAMLLGPLLESAFGLQGIFGFVFICAVMGIILLYSVMPNAGKLNPYFDYQQKSVLTQFISVLINKNLIRLNVGILCLHAVFASCFLFVPNLILRISQAPVHQSWQVYGPVLLCSVLLMSPFVRLADKTQQRKSIVLMGMLSLLLSILFLFYTNSVWGLYVGLIIFFAAFNILESVLPAWVSILAPSDKRGAALGVYSTSQFFGIFLGGAVGGSLLQAFGLQGLALWCMVLCLLFIGAMSYVKRY